MCTSRGSGGKGRGDVTLVTLRILRSHGGVGNPTLVTVGNSPRTRAPCTSRPSREGRAGTSGPKSPKNDDFSSPRPVLGEVTQNTRVSYPRRKSCCPPTGSGLSRPGDRPRIRSGGPWRTPRKGRTTDGWPETHFNTSKVLQPTTTYLPQGKVVSRPNKGERQDPTPALEGSLGGRKGTPG